MHYNAERKEFRRSRLFIVTVRLIDMLMIDGGVERKRADILTLVFM